MIDENKSRFKRKTPDEVLQDAHGDWRVRFEYAPSQEQQEAAKAAHEKGLSLDVGDEYRSHIGSFKETAEGIPIRVENDSGRYTTQEVLVGYAQAFQREF